MRFGFILLILLLSIFIGIWIHHDPGYALFVYQDWTIEMPLWLATGLSVGIAVLFIGFLSILRDTERTLQSWSFWWRHRAQRQQEKLALEQQKCRQLLYQTAVHGEMALSHSWRELPREKRRDPLLIQDYVTLLLKQQGSVLAEEVLREALKKAWHASLIYLYGIAEGKDQEKQLKQAETWLKHHPEDHVLYLSLGRLCIRNHLWGKAREYLENSLRIQATPEAYGELAKLLEMTGKFDESTRYYKKGLLDAIAAHGLLHNSPFKIDQRSEVISLKTL